MINLLKYPVLGLLDQLLDVSNGRLVVSMGLEQPLGNLVDLWTDRIDTLLNDRFGFASDRIHSTIPAICLHKFIIWLHDDQNLVLFPALFLFFTVVAA